MTSKSLNLLVGLALLTHPSLVSTSKFSTNCTLPNESKTIISSANIRGTFDILWSGLFTIFICIWTVQHLNVPEQRNGRDQGWRGDLKWMCKGFPTKFKWMSFTLIFPEFLLAKAFVEMAVARGSMKSVRRWPGPHGTELTEVEISNWTRTHAFYAEMGGFLIRPYDNQRSEFRVVATADIMKLRTKGLLQSLPTISADHLKDMSKGDAFTKAAAIVQVSWMVIQVIVRATKGLPITQLEITACGFAASTFLTYLLWWDKPQAVTTVTELPIEAESDGVLSSLHTRCFGVAEAVLDWNLKSRKLFDNEPMPNEAIAIKYNFKFFIGFLLGGMMLGAVQCAAWNFHFPTKVELYLWRYLNIGTMAAFPVMYWTTVTASLVSERSQEFLLPGMNYIALVIYTIGRLFVLFETIYSLFHLPPGAFVSTWSSSIPHVA